MSSSRPVPYVRIVHQPSSVYRMRYKKENRSTFLYAENATQSQQTQNTQQPTSSTASTSNASTTGAKKAVRKKGGAVSNDAPDGTFPKIEIVNGCGPATLIVSCVSKKEPHHVHPHKLIGNCCRSGVAILNIGEGETFFELSGISIEYTKQSEIEESINELKSKNVDPFNVGFGFDRKTIDQTQLRLCFQVYLRDTLSSTEIIRDKYHILEPVVSQIISNSSRKATLLIERTSKLYAPPDGNNEITIFIKRLEKDQKMLHVKFYDESNWVQSFRITDIHYQSAMIIKPPPYKKQDIDKNHTVWLKLYVPFASEDEKQKYMKKLKNEENDDEENNENDEDGENSSQLVVPDGKYESRELEFDYVPFVSQKRKLDANLQLYDTSDHVEKEGHSEINEVTRSKLKKRNHELQSNTVSQSNHQTANVSLEFFINEESNSNFISDVSLDPTMNKSSINNSIVNDANLVKLIDSECSQLTNNSILSNNSVPYNEVTANNFNTGNTNNELIENENPVVNIDQLNFEDLYSFFDDGTNSKLLDIQESVNKF